LRSELAKMQGEFAKALPGHITAERFVRTAQTAVALTRNIEKVRNPASLLAACSKAAADGLILDGREAALVVDYQGDVQYRPMMRGLLKLAYNSGMVKSIVVEPVHDADLFDYQPTRSDEPIIHKIDLKADRGDWYAVYAKAEFKDGGIVFEVMTKADVFRIRDRSDAYKTFKANKIKSTPWSTDELEMSRKTVFRRLSKYLPASADRDDRLHQAAERIDEDYTFDIDAAPASADAAPAATKKRGAGAALLKNVTPKDEARGRPDRQPDPEPVQDNDYDPETGEVYDDEQQPEDDI
jgi:recombinase, phage RecT family